MFTIIIYIFLKLKIEIQKKLFVNYIQKSIKDSYIIFKQIKKHNYNIYK